MTWNSSNRLERLPPWWSKFTVEYLRDHRVCALKYEGCQIEATEVDHKINGDNHDLSNLQPVCERCHAKKSSKEGNLAKAKLRSLRKRPKQRHPGQR